MAEPEIKPCPFCGSKDVTPTTYFDGDDYEEWRVFCSDCEAQGPPKCESYNEEPIDAINSWNRRPPEEGFDERELATSGIIKHRDAEILRLKNRIAELEAIDG